MNVYAPNHMLSQVMTIGVYTDDLSNLLTDWGLMEKLKFCPGSYLYNINSDYMDAGLGYLVYGEGGFSPKNFPQFWWSPAGGVLVESLYWKMHDVDRTLTAEQLLKQHIEYLKANNIARGYCYLPDMYTIPKFNKRAFCAAVKRTWKIWRLE
ncbi:MAG: hypothetical protein NT118_15130 [Lentisphaerae bacterium]|nr:hypothetical protein [Lentisphaerota bacterium]